MNVIILPNCSSAYYHQVRKKPLDHGLVEEEVSDLVAMALRKFPCPMCFPNQFNDVMLKLKELEDAELASREILCERGSAPG